jgi:ABC-2 type transport system permease protein
MNALPTLVRRDTRNMIIRPMFIFYSTGFPLAMILILGLLSQGFYRGPLSSWDVVAVNLLLYQSLLSCSMSTNSFLERSLKAPNLRVLFAPVRPLHLLLSKAIASTLFCLGGFAIVFAILEALGVKLGPLCGLELFGMVAALSFASTALGLWVVCLVRDESGANMILNLVMGILACTGGVFFSIERFGPVAATLARYSPFTWLREIAFTMIWNGGDPIGYAATIGLSLVAAVLLLGAARAAFKTEDFV